jgi:hypothetical protein
MRIKQSKLMLLNYKKFNINNRPKKCYEILLSNEENSCINNPIFVNKLICDKMRLIIFSITLNLNFFQILDAQNAIEKLTVIKVINLLKIVIIYLFEIIP